MGIGPEAYRSFQTAQEALAARYPGLARRVPKNMLPQLMGLNPNRLASFEYKVAGGQPVPHGIKIHDRGANSPGYIEDIAHEVAHYFDATRNPGKFMESANDLDIYRKLHSRGLLSGEQFTDAWRSAAHEQKAVKASGTALKSIMRAVGEGRLSLASWKDRLPLKGAGAAKLGLPLLALLAASGLMGHLFSGGQEEEEQYA